MNNNIGKPSQRLQELGIILPPVPTPVAAYVPCTRVNNMLQTSGQLPMLAGKLAIIGKVGQGVSLEEAQQAARLCAINALAALVSKVDISDIDSNSGDTIDEGKLIDAIARIWHVTVFVNSAPGFTDQALVANGASELFKELFGQAGEHTRSAVGVAELPINAPVEVEVRAVVGR